MADFGAIDRCIATADGLIGTGTVTVAAVAGYYAYATQVPTNGDTHPYMIEACDANRVPTGDFEFGIGTRASATTFTRTTVYGSSNSGAPVSFAAGNKNVIIGGPLAKEQRNMLTTLLSADRTNSTVTLADITDLVFTAEANATYEVEICGAFTAAATTTGLAVALNIPSGSVIGQLIHPTSATALGGTEQIADDANTGATTGVRAATTNVPFLFKGVVQIGVTGGAVQARFRSEVAASAVVIKANLTYMKARKISGNL